MRAAADAFAMGVEQDQFDIREVVFLHQLGELQAQPLDQEGGASWPT